MSKKPAKTNESLRYKRDKDRQIVKGIFSFHEVPGGTLKFLFKAYKEDPVEEFTLVDGEVYSIPLGVARHLNKNGWYPKYSYTQDIRGLPVMEIGQKVRRFSFRSLEFIDIDDIESVGSPVRPDIVTASPMGGGSGGMGPSGSALPM